jgi:hypothetical protein
MTRLRSKLLYALSGAPAENGMQPDTVNEARAFIADIRFRPGIVGCITPQRGMMVETDR